MLSDIALKGLLGVNGEIAILFFYPVFVLSVKPRLRCRRLKIVILPGLGVFAL